jgi:hypothetical protein
LLTQERLKTISILIDLMESFDGNRACAFCNTAIDDDGSICDKCMTIYNIKTSDAFNDGCGCDT